MIPKGNVYGEYDIFECEEAPIDIQIERYKNLLDKMGKVMKREEFNGLNFSDFNIALVTMKDLETQPGNYSQAIRITKK